MAQFEINLQDLQDVFPHVQWNIYSKDESGIGAYAQAEAKVPESDLHKGGWFNVFLNDYGADASFNVRQIDKFGIASFGSHPTVREALLDLKEQLISISALFQDARVTCGDAS